MIQLVPAVITGLFGLGREWIKGKRDEAKAKQEARISAIKNEANWDNIMAQGAMASWKDEFWTLVIAIPAILAFIPGMDQLVTAGFAALQNMPTWYQAALGLSVAASFGYRKFVDFMTKKKTNG